MTSLFQSAPPATGGGSLILSGSTATVKLSLREAIRVGEARDQARCSAGGTFRDMEEAGERAAQRELMRVLADRLRCTPDDPYGAVPKRVGDRWPTAPPSAANEEAGSLVDAFA
jgi:hypothetical protein